MGHSALTIVSTIGLLPAPRVHAPLRPRPSSVCASLPPPPPQQHVFDVETATLLAGFAFEAYNEPEEGDARWERGADGCNVAFMSDGFAAECYAGRLEVTLHEVRDLPPPKQLNLNLNDPASLLSGGNVDPYVVFALNEEAAKGPKEGAVGLQRATDLARTATRWASEAKRGTARGAAEWPDGGEEIYLYVKKVEEAQLALTAFDEDVLKEDEARAAHGHPMAAQPALPAHSLPAAPLPAHSPRHPSHPTPRTQALGAASVRLSSLLSPDPGGGGSWGGWIPLTWRPAETKDNAVLAGSVAGAVTARESDGGARERERCSSVACHRGLTAGPVAGAFIAGPVGAAAGGVLANTFLKKEAQGEARGASLPRPPPRLACEGGRVPRHSPPIPPSLAHGASGARLPPLRRAGGAARRSAAAAAAVADDRRRAARPRVADCGGDAAAGAAAPGGAGEAARADAG